MDGTATAAPEGSAGAQVQVEGEIGILQVHHRAAAPALPLQIHQGVLHLQGGVVAVVQLRQAAARLHLEAGLGGQPVVPVGSVLDAVVQVGAAAAGEAGQLPQEAEGDAGAQVEAIEAGQVGAAGHGAAQGTHLFGAQGRQLGGGHLLEAGGHHGGEIEILRGRCELLHHSTVPVGAPRAVGGLIAPPWSGDPS